MKRMIALMIFVSFILSGCGKSAQQFYESGKQKFDNKDYHGCIKDLTEAIDKDSKYSDAWFLRGIASKNLQDTVSALNDYSKAIEINPSHKQAFYMRGSLLFNLKRFTEAISDYTKAIELDAGYLDALHMRGKALHNIGKYEEAIEDQLAVAKIDPKHHMAYYMIGHSYRKLNDLQGCILYFEKAIDLNNGFADAWFFRGEAYINLGNLTQGCQDMMQAQKLGNQNAEIMLKKHCN